MNRAVADVVRECDHRPVIEAVPLLEKVCTRVHLFRHDVVTDLARLKFLHEHVIEPHARLPGCGIPDVTAPDESLNLLRPRAGRLAVDVLFPRIGERLPDRPWIPPDGARGLLVLNLAIQHIRRNPVAEHEILPVFGEVERCFVREKDCAGARRARNPFRANVGPHMRAKTMEQFVEDSERRMEIPVIPLLHNESGEFLLNAKLPIALFLPLPVVHIHVDDVLNLGFEIVVERLLGGDDALHLAVIDPRPP